MTTTIEAIYENGVLRPLSPLSLPEGQHVQVSVASEEPGRSKTRPRSCGKSPRYRLKARAIHLPVVTTIGLYGSPSSTMSDLVFVDTSAWFAAVAPVDANHTAADAWFKDNHCPLATTDYVVDETLTLLRARGEGQRDNARNQLLCWPACYGALPNPRGNPRRLASVPQASRQKLELHRLHQQGCHGTIGLHPSDGVRRPFPPVRRRFGGAVEVCARQRQYLGAFQRARHFSRSRCTFPKGGRSIQTCRYPNSFALEKVKCRILSGSYISRLP